MIVGELLLEMVPSLAYEVDPQNFPDARFPLHHPNLSADIFVDGDCNITCITDWAFSSAVPLSTLLVTPGLPQQRNKQNLPMDSAFRLGFDEERCSCAEADTTDAGRHDAAWESCKKIWLFTLWCGGMLCRTFGTSQRYTDQCTEGRKPKLFA